MLIVILFHYNLCDLAVVEEVLHDEQVLFERGRRLRVRVPDAVNAQDLGQSCRLL